MKNIQIYVCVNKLPNTKVVINYLLERIAYSALNEYPINLCHSNDFENVQTKLNVQYHNTRTDYTAFEYPTLKKLWVDSNNQEEFYGLYLHCKGSSKTTNLELSNCFAWADYMLYGLLDNADLCLNHLSNGADLVGSMWHWHFKGNFFWFNSSYIKQLIDPLSMNTASRFEAEYWCALPLWYNQGKFPKIKNLFYIPSLKNDNDFLEHRKSGYIPNLNSCTHLNEPFEEFLQKRWYGSFDKITVTKQEYEKYHCEIYKFLNYDGTVSIVES